TARWTGLTGLGCSCRPRSRLPASGSSDRDGLSGGSRTTWRPSRMPYRSGVMPEETPKPLERDRPTSTCGESAHHPGFGGSGEVVLAGHRGVLARQVSHGIPRMVSRRSTIPGTNEAPHKAVSRRGISPYGFGAGTRWTTLREFGTTPGTGRTRRRSEEHTSELQSRENLVCRLLLDK